ncbi:alpha-glucan family phosphorylase, partial [Nostoc sp.]|uniref:alpha-glucan family phosphorylase n=1 Tax=Nostoc sp. TaxID=1180 RepID=UPI0035933209
MNSQDALSPAAQLQTKLPRPLHSLAELAYNFWWSWSPERLSIFRTIDAEKWEQFHHNPVKLLKKVSYERLVQLAVDPHYLQQVRTLTSQFEQYIQQNDTWTTQTVPQIRVEQPVAYFSIEYGLHQSLPLYAGGLGILAADHLKSASDLGLPLVGVGLLYRQGYFHQRFTSQGWQREDYVDYQFEELPIELLCDVQGEPLAIEIDIRQRQVKAQIWQVRVGRINLYLLDTDREDNDPIDRWITGQLYGGKRDTRIAQEMLLGIG